jgi:hypothetical protein
MDPYTGSGGDAGATFPEETAMSRFIGIVFIYAAMVLGCSGVGLFMLIAPARFGNLLYDSFQLFPQVRPGDWGKKLVVRLLGVALIAFAVRFIVRIVQLAQ